MSDTIYQEGYQLHHLFLSSFDDKKHKLSFLDQNKGYDLKEVLYILSMINFNGKLVVDCQDPSAGTPDEFSRNAEYLDKILKEIGYKKTNIDEIDDGSYISALWNFIFCFLFVLFLSCITSKNMFKFKVETFLNFTLGNVIMGV